MNFVSRRPERKPARTEAEILLEIQEWNATIASMTKIIAETEGYLKKTTDPAEIEDHRVQIERCQRVIRRSKELRFIAATKLGIQENYLSDTDA